MNKGSILVVVPSYNSKHGILRTISGVLKVLPEVFVLVVDDSSPDGTQFLIRKHILFLLGQYLGSRRQ